MNFNLFVWIVKIFLFQQTNMFDIIIIVMMSFPQHNDINFWIV